MHFAPRLHSCWTRTKITWQSSWPQGYKDVLPYELLSFVSRNLTLQNCFKGTCEGISRFGCFILSLLEFFAASVETQTYISLSTAKSWWERAGKGKRKRRKWGENSGEGWEKAKQELPGQIFSQHKILLLYQQLIWFGRFLSLLNTTFSLRFCVPSAVVNVKSADCVYPI